jgi:hypothetical protein
MNSRSAACAAAGRNHEQCFAHLLRRLSLTLACAPAVWAEPPRLPVPAVDQSAVAQRGYFFVGGTRLNPARVPDMMATGEATSPPTPQNVHRGIRVQPNATIRLIEKLLNRPIWSIEVRRLLQGLSRPYKPRRGQQPHQRAGRRRWIMIKTLTMLATAATIVIGIPASSNASARVLHYPQEHANVGHAYRPPAGQIWVRGFQNAPTPEERLRQDFQLDGAYE